MSEHEGAEKLSRYLMANAPDLRRAWRTEAHFDAVAAMHVNQQGEQMLRALAEWLVAGDADNLRKLAASPPWTGNDADADAPLSLVVSLKSCLRAALASDRVRLAAAVKLTDDLSAAIDSVQRERFRRLGELAARDSLTGTFSRQAILDRLDAECTRSRRYVRPLGVVYMDVEGLKQTNDEMGHSAGDSLLTRLSKTVAGNLRASDAFGRLGGDEFLAILPETDAAGTKAVASKLKSLLGEQGIGVRFGVATVPETEPARQALIDAADSAMRQQRSRRAE